VSNSRLRYLPQWIDTLSTHVAGWSAARPPKGRTAEALPAPLLLLALRGEGVLRLRYTDWAADSPLNSAPDQSLALWNSLWEDGAEIRPLCERIGLARLASEHTAIPTPTWPVQPRCMHVSSPVWRRSGARICCYWPPTSSLRWRWHASSPPLRPRRSA
jgi:hypothetical protein